MVQVIGGLNQLQSLMIKLWVAQFNQSYTVIIGSDDHTQNWCEFVVTVSTPIYSVMFTPTIQYTTYNLCEQFVRED